MVTRVARLVINVTDIERSIGFYKLLGFQAKAVQEFDGVVDALGVPGSTGRSVILTLLGKPSLELVEWATPQKTESGRYPSMRHTGICRFAMVTFDLEGDLARLKEVGVSPVGGRPVYCFNTGLDEGGKMMVAVVEDPDGTAVTIAHANADGSWTPRSLLPEPLPRLINKKGQPQGLKMFHCSPVVSDYDKSLPFYQGCLGFRLDRDCGVTEPGSTSAQITYTEQGWVDGTGNVPLGALLGLPGVAAKALILNVGQVPKNPLDAGLLLDMVQFVEPFPTISRPAAPIRQTGISRLVVAAPDLAGLARELEKSGYRPVAAPAIDRNGLAVSCWRDPDGIMVQVEEEKAASASKL